MERFREQLPQSGATESRKGCQWEWDGGEKAAQGCREGDQLGFQSWNGDADRKLRIG